MSTCSKNTESGTYRHSPGHGIGVVKTELVLFSRPKLLHNRGAVHLDRSAATDEDRKMKFQAAAG